MANLNRVLLIGNCTREPDTRYTPKGTAVTDISLAINRQWKADSGEKKEEVTFVDITIFGRTAEVAQEYLRKGSPVFIEGRLTLDTWKDRDTGKDRSKLKVVGESIQLLGSRQQAATAAPPAKPTAPAAKSRPEPDPDLDAEPSDITF
jgi:single-strand DNA-binding protein